MAKSSQAKETPISVEVKADKTVTVRDTKGGSERKATMKEVGAIVQQMQGGDATRPVVISGDKKVEYDAILQIMDALQQQGVARVGLAVKPKG